MSRAIEQAIEWTACLRSGQVEPHERRAFDAWLAADPSHAQAWAAVQSHLGIALGPLADRNPAVRRALQVSGGRRALLRGALALAGIGIGAHLLGRPGMPLELGADLRSGTGERLNSILADGSQLQLDACSAVDLAFDATARNLTLRSGKLIVDIHLEARPFRVHTPCGSVSATDGRVMVALHDNRVHAWALDTSARIETHNGAHLTLQGGQGARFDTTRIEPLPANRSGESSWAGGWLSVDDWSLAEVVDALRPYRHGVLRVAPEAAGLRVSGLFPLDDSDRALAALEQAMPLRIDHYLGWWTRIELRG
jgi:transmembrane sensor